MSVSIEILDLIRSLQNEVMLISVDPDESLVSADPKIESRLQFVISTLESFFPMIQAAEELITGEIHPKLFQIKWTNAMNHIGVGDDLDVDDIDTEITGFLDKMSSYDDEEGEEI